MRVASTLNFLSLPYESVVNENPLPQATEPTVSYGLLGYRLSYPGSLKYPFIDPLAMENEELAQLGGL